MDRGGWGATVHGVSRIGHDGATKAPHRPPQGTAARLHTGLSARRALLPNLASVLTAFTASTLRSRPA